MEDFINLSKPSACFEVQKVIGISTTVGNCRTYQVQWAPSWISGFHLIGCEDLIEQFERELRDTEADIKIEVDDDYLSNSSLAFGDENNEEEREYVGSLTKPLAEAQIQNNVVVNTNHGCKNQTKQCNSNVNLKATSLDSIIQNIASDRLTQDVDLPNYLPQEESTGNSDSANNVGCNLYRNQVSYQKINENNEADDKVDTSHGASVQKKDQYVRRATPHPNFKWLKENASDIYHGGGSKNVLSFQFDVPINNGVNGDGGNVDTTTVTATSLVSQISDYALVSQTADCGGDNNNTSGMEDVNIVHKLPVHESQSVPLRENENGKWKIKLKNGKLKETFECTVCKKTFSSSLNLNNHSRIHIPTKEVYKCNTCYKIFSSKSNLETHELIHSSIKIFSCSFCEKKFVNYTYLQNHLKTHQMTRFSIRCSVCDKAFLTKADLNRHNKRVHIAARDFECDVCRKRFKLKHHLTTHSKSQHPIEGKCVV